MLLATLAYLVCENFIMESKENWRLVFQWYDENKLTIVTIAIFACVKYRARIKKIRRILSIHICLQQ